MQLLAVPALHAEQVESQSRLFLILLEFDQGVGRFTIAGLGSRIRKISDRRTRGTH